MVSLFSIAYAIACPLQGRIAERVGVSRMLLFGIFTNACLYLVYQTYLLWAVALNMFILALVAYGFFPALQAQRFTIRRPTVMGLLSSSLYIGITIGATVGGLGYSISGMLGVIAIAFVLALFGLGAAAFLNLPP